MCTVIHVSIWFLYAGAETAFIVEFYTISPRVITARCIIYETSFVLLYGYWYRNFIAFLRKKYQDHKR